MMKLRFFMFVISAGLVSAQSPNPIVRIPLGKLQGTWEVSTKGRSYASFRSIPYAQPPIGDYRFREPQPIRPWSGVRNVTQLSPVCLQYEPFQMEITGTEDCLFLNVYTPQLQRGANLPVFVFIHGGGFIFGGSNIYGPDNLMDWDMVVVTLNYRLGPLGFLSTGDAVVPGNNGLKDQLLAMRWVKSYITLFGGNQDSITLAGESAGGVSVHYHFLSPMARGLFARGISYSGSALSSWAINTKPAEKSKFLGSVVGCPTDTSKELVDCLRSKSGTDIVNAQTQIIGWKFYLFSPFTPVVEAPEVQEAFLQQFPYQATRNGGMTKVPLITTVTSEEGLYPAAVYQRDPSTLPELEARWNELASYIYLYNDTLPINRRTEVAQRIKWKYFADKPVSQETFLQLVHSLGDRLFYNDVGRLAHMHADNFGVTYVLRYAYRGSWSVSNGIAQNNISYGVSHGDDILRIFKVPGMDTNQPEERAMVEQLINIIYSFSVFGTPKLNNSGTTWFPMQPWSSQLHYLDVLSPYKSEMKYSIDFGHKSFWNHLGFHENEYYHG